MYKKATVQFRNHIKLDVHWQFTHAVGRNVVTLEGIDVCSLAWRKPWALVQAPCIPTPKMHVLVTKPNSTGILANKS